jgi:hypothetical protein
MWKSARFRVGQSLNPYAPHYRTPFASSTLLTRIPVGVPYGVLSSPKGEEKYGLTAFRTQTSRRT